MALDKDFIDGLRIKVMAGGTITDEDFITLRNGGYDTYQYDMVMDVMLERVEEKMRPVYGLKEHISNEWRRLGHLPTPKTELFDA